MLMRTTALLVAFVAVMASVACRGGSDLRAGANNPVFVLMETTAGDIVLELESARAPISVANFLTYARRGAYDGTIFHRVIPTFVIQGGGYDPALNERAEADAAAGRPDVLIKNEWRNGLKNLRGTIAMARETEPDSATRQFYINIADNPKLDSAREATGNAGYAVFGRVIAGMDVVDRIKDVPVRSVPEKELENVPIDPVVIAGVRTIEPAEARRRLAMPAHTPRPAR